MSLLGTVQILFFQLLLFPFTFWRGARLQSSHSLKNCLKFAELLAASQIILLGSPCLHMKNESIRAQYFISMMRIPIDSELEDIFKFQARTFPKYCSGLLQHTSIKPEVGTHTQAIFQLAGQNLDAFALILMRHFIGEICFTSFLN